MEYENAQKRILDVFRRWEAPQNFKIEMFVIRVGDWGGYMLLDCDDPLAVHKFCSMLPAFVFEARPVEGVGAGGFAIARLKFRNDASVTRHAHGWTPLDRS